MHKSALLDWLWVTNIVVLLYKLWRHSLYMISKLSLQGMIGRMSCHSEYHHQEGWSLSLRLLLSYNLLSFFIPFFIPFGVVVFCWNANGPMVKTLTFARDCGLSLYRETKKQQISTNFPIFTFSFLFLKKVGSNLL